jgi:hypothetical protein
VGKITIEPVGSDIPTSDVRIGVHFLGMFLVIEKICPAVTIADWVAANSADLIEPLEFISPHEILFQPKNLSALHAMRYLVFIKTPFLFISTKYRNLFPLSIPTFLTSLLDSYGLL